MTDMLRETVEAEHKNVSFAGTEMEEIWRLSISNDSETFTEAGDTVEVFGLTEK